jgi:WhiB family redox-sensing transcriptional regulator
MVLIDLAEPEAWTDSALCAQIDPEIFFPNKGDVVKAATARRICGDCPVSTQCLTAAMEEDQRWGIWGGYTAHERYKMKRREQARDQRARRRARNGDSI